jgi:hypothetical protein
LTLEHELSEEQTVLHLALVLASFNNGHDSLERTSHYSSESLPAYDLAFSCVLCETVYSAYGCTMSNREMTEHRLGSMVGLVMLVLSVCKGNSRLDSILENCQGPNLTLLVELSR